MYRQNLINKTPTLLLALLLTFGLHAAHADDLTSWKGTYRGIFIQGNSDDALKDYPTWNDKGFAVIIQTGNINTFSFENRPYGKNSKTLDRIIVTVANSLKDNPRAVVTKDHLYIPPTFAHPFSLEVKRVIGGFDEEIIEGKMTQYSLENAGKPEVRTVTRFKVGQVK